LIENAWYKKEIIKKKILDSSDSYNKGTSSKDNYLRYGVKTSDAKWTSNNDVLLFCDKFKAVSQNNNTNNLTGSY
jgi:hypothetical protein